MAAPAVVHSAITLGTDGRSVFALRDDGAVFVLLRRGSMRADMTTVAEPTWSRCPAVPGTIAHVEEQG